jgi:hypothetical protein
MIDNKVITNAKYIADSEGNNSVVSCTINGVGVSVPLDLGNADFAEIQRQVAAGELTIEEAD